MKQYASRAQQGFTLIELMIVVAIIGILAAFATAAYQDYTIRTRISEGLQMAAPVKTAVAEYRMSQNAWPTTNTMAGVNAAASLTSSNVTSIEVGANGVITITYSAASGVSGGTLTLTPGQTNSGDPVTWACASPSSSIDNRYLPANCRS